MKLQNKRVLSSAFKEKGRDDVVMIEVFSIENGELIKLTIEEKNSPWRQGIWLQTDGELVINEQRSSNMVLWQDSSPTDVVIECLTKCGCIHLYNVWDKGDGRKDSQSWSSGMIVKEIPIGRRYHCNDIGFDTDFRKLIFRIERMTQTTASPNSQI